MNIRQHKYVFSEYNLPSMSMNGNGPLLFPQDTHLLNIVISLLVDGEFSGKSDHQ